MLGRMVSVLDRHGPASRAQRMSMSQYKVYRFIGGCGAGCIAGPRPTLGHRCRVDPYLSVRPCRSDEARYGLKTCMDGAQHRIAVQLERTFTYQRSQTPESDL